MNRIIWFTFIAAILFFGAFIQRLLLGAIFGIGWSALGFLLFTTITLILLKWKK